MENKRVELALAKYSVIDSSVKTSWNKNDKRILYVIISILTIGVTISISGLFDSLINKDFQVLVSFAIPLMSLFILISVIENRKPFAFTNKELFLYPQRLVIKSQERKEISIDKLTEIQFSFSGEDGGFFHPILNPKRNRGNLNILTISMEKEKIQLELYLPKKSDGIRMKNIIQQYRKQMKFK